MNSKLNDKTLLGTRVRVKQNGLIAVIVGTPEYYTPKAKLIRIKYENSTRYEYNIDTMLEPLPIKEQWVSLGGEFVRPENYF
tara:strand:+ start:1090 stop:1335 length:246 start_codon:yes stop_codon:yes gene_type:complete